MTFEHHSTEYDIHVIDPGYPPNQEYRRATILSTNMLSRLAGRTMYKVLKSLIIVRSGPFSLTSKIELIIQGKAVIVECGMI